MIVVGLVGFSLSVLLHELFHALIHWNHIANIGSILNNGSIAEILITEPQAYDLEGEEMVAYLITFIVIIATVMLIYKIYDATDTRSSHDILFPNRLVERSTKRPKQQPSNKTKKH
ncbi:MAG: hypothetical protein WAW80_01070 [Candidatus Saccharimonadales bacterium]